MSTTQTTGGMPGTPPTAEEESRVRSTAHGAAEQASALATTGRDEFARVAQDVRAQSTRLVGDARSSARDRADAQFGQIATRLHDLQALERPAPQTMREIKEDQRWLTTHER